MKMVRCSLVFLLATLVLLNSCVSRKKLTYLQYLDKTEKNVPEGEIGRTSVTPNAYKILPYDNLYIRVITPDPEWSALFNIMPVGAGGTITEESVALFGYPVDLEGYIEIPFVGKIEAGGKTLAEVKSELDSIFRNYLTEAAITIRLVNNYVSVIGEVSRPGRYLLTKDRVNVFEALALAGDMNAFGSRNNVKLIRPSPYGPVIKEFSLEDRSIMTSEFYYIMPNDIIYAMPLNRKSFEINASVWTMLLNTITSALGVIAFFRTL